jgi:hypothetical protein
VGIAKLINEVFGEPTEFSIPNMIYISTFLWPVSIIYIGILTIIDTLRGD